MGGQDTTVARATRFTNAEQSCGDVRGPEKLIRTFEAGDRMPAFVLQLHVGLQPVGGRFADQHRTAEGRGQLLDPEREIYLGPHQVLLSERGATDEDFPEMDDDPEA